MSIESESSAGSEFRDESFDFEVGDRAFIRFPSIVKDEIDGNFKLECSTGEVVDVSCEKIRIMLDDHTGTTTKEKTDCHLIKKYYMVMNDGCQNNE